MARRWERRVFGLYSILMAGEDRPAFETATFLSSWICQEAFTYNGEKHNPRAGLEDVFDELHTFMVQEPQCTTEDDLNAWLDALYDWCDEHGVWIDPTDDPAAMAADLLR